MGRVSMPQGGGSQMHNKRDYVKFGKSVPDNINQEKTCQNITLCDRNIKEVYKEIFGEALSNYNAKQKRADRKIVDYYQHIKSSKNGEKVFYEDVLQWGKKEDFENDPKKRESAQAALIEYFEGFEERNPNLKLIGAYIHMDEASPHGHFDYVPVAHGYKRGLETRNSLDRAMKEMGFVPDKESRKNNATMLWKAREREVFADICKKYGLEVEPERKSERKNLTVAEYKDARDSMMCELEQEREELKANIKPLQELKIEIDEVKNTGKNVLGNVVIKQNDFKQLQAQAQSYIANRDEVESLRERTAELDERTSEVEEREADVQRREQEVEAKAKEVQSMYTRQLSLNRLLEQTEEKYRKKEHECLEKDDRIDTLTSYNNDLKSKLKDWQEYADRLKDGVRRAYEYISSIIQAVSSFKYDDKYKIDNMTPNQSRLIDALEKYACKHTREDGKFDDLVDEMKKNYWISPGIQDALDTQRQRTQSRGMRH